MLLNEQEIALWLHIADEPISFARAIESAVLEKLKEQEPVAFTNSAQLGYVKDGMHPDIPLAMWATNTPYSGANIKLYARPLPPDDVAQKYDELLYAVHKKFPDETRHQTALRYIKTAESPSYTNAAMKGMK